jgi:hypothetical protein
VQPPEQSYGRYASAAGTEHIPLQQPGERSPGNQTKLHESPARPFAGVSQVSAKRKLPKWLLITICAICVILTAVIIIVLSNAAGRHSAAVNSPGASIAPSATEKQADLQPKEGECLYTGSGTYFDIDYLKFSFILPYAMGANVCGVITTAILTGIYVTLIPLIK